MLASGSTATVRSASSELRLMRQGRQRRETSIRTLLIMNGAIRGAEATLGQQLTARGAAFNKHPMDHQAAHPGSTCPGTKVAVAPTCLPLILQRERRKNRLELPRHRPDLFFSASLVLASIVL